MRSLAGQLLEACCCTAGRLLALWDLRRTLALTIDSPTHATAFAPTTFRQSTSTQTTRAPIPRPHDTARPHVTAVLHLTAHLHLTALLRRITLSLGLLLVEWSTRPEAYSRAHSDTETLTDTETLIRRHHTHRAVEQEQRRAEARMLMAPLAW